ncbi:hypothetical protein GYMLUDRAFT_251484 [Collybiopsis luxurians FD-317 M1]|uniref:Uncharacterized protein n=1 Tax=Collybiopsis luxurians FD-317 M1 TaxID=944289 RepID=A0A0D0C2Q7_9AGAR|nr:hypothetical protein GYMLUDRAFT_251484 [Collybiopsis luxurians FD-317 M1]
MSVCLSLLSFWSLTALCLSNTIPPDPFLSFLTFPDLCTLVATSSTCRAHVNAFRLHDFRPDNTLRPFFALSDIPSFMDLLSLTGCIIAGSVAFKFFSCESYESDLDLFCSVLWCGSMGSWLLAHGFVFCPTTGQYDTFYSDFTRVATASPSPLTDSSSSDYDSAGIVELWCFSASNGTRPIQLVGTVYSPVTSLLSFHSTCVLNFFNHHSAYHKSTCERNRHNQANWSSERHLASSALRKFIDRHCPSIAKAALHAFKLRSRPQQALHNVLTIYVSDRRGLFPGSRVHREMVFYALDTKVLEIGNMGPVRELLQDEAICINMVARKKGLKGAVFVLVICGDLQISIILPIDFDYEVQDTLDAGEEWKIRLLTYLNKGIIV